MCLLVGPLALNRVPEAEKRIYEERTKNSLEMFEKSREYTPFGVHSNYRFVDPYPLYCSRAVGPRIWDVDGNQYLDFNMGFGALVTGHSHPTLVKAIQERVESGTLFGFESDEGYSLAKLISQRFKVDMVKFSTTGLEGTMHAIRLARAFTAKKKILKFEGCYHGSHDSVLVSVKPTAAKAGHNRFPAQVAASQGLPEEVVKNTLVAPFNDLDSTQKIMEKNSDCVAAIILEPVPMNMGLVQPVQGFLEGLRKLCEEYNAVLIFDEVKTSGKFYGGAAGHYRVRPDLMVLGKAIAGGYPLSALAGKREIMETIVPGVVSHAGTFNSNPLSVSAGLATLSKILTEEAFFYLDKLGEELGRGYSDIVDDAKVSAKVSWLGPSGAVFFGEKEVNNWRDFLRCDVGAWWTYYVAMLNRGVVPGGTGPDEQWTLSVQHGKEEVQQHLESFKQIAPLLKSIGLSMRMVEAI
jgi:glutamate-1-semialdehyde 2,1-aminomutase